ncbi:ABC transporter ATP-binding protein [Thauera sp. CAU 1555]|uniref:ABC transporter ATP-binding protein n=2 Tax=Thauera sedimentorum TaxID=2767595 RepID=A0ABR9B9P0_9RHOO|nr:ABC transporter ATP-binding protein [Thauera sedimentorum]MBD8502669.1 ABC transporter ATP-binding protein [Thauera sedimentorum]
MLADLAVRVAEKRYPGAAQPAIAELAFELPARQFCCIVGPSGCGKTSLLNILAGLDRAARAEVRFGDGSTPAAAPIGYMFQTPRLLPWRTVRDNVRVVLDAQAVAAGRAEQLLDEMGLGTCLDAYPGQLSGGMQRRVALARAFAIEPRLLLLDEPFVSLDHPVAEHLRDMLLELWQRHPTTVLFVTHDLREAIQLADRILFLSRAPSQVILDVAVDLPRPRRAEDAACEDFRRALLARHRDLLAGVAEEGAEGVRCLGDGAMPKPFLMEHPAC